MDILNLPNLKTLSVSETSDTFRITAEPTSTVPCCLKCGVIRRNGLSRFGSKEQVYLDIPIRGKRVAIQVDRQRYRCHDCGSTFYELMPDMHDKHFATKRLIEHIEQEALRKTFTSIATDVGIDEKLVRNIFKAFADQLNQNYRPVIPKWIGIDEIHLIGKPRCVITDITNKTVIDFLPNRNKQTVIDYFTWMRGRRNIECVTMDMWRPYKDAVNYMCPDARVIVDRFHVVKMANKALDDIRKSIRVNLTAKERKLLMRSRYILLRRQSQLSEKDVETLDEWSKSFPELSNAYTLKEMFFDIWESPSRYDAVEQYHAWLSLVTEDVFPAFKDVITAMNNWHEEIFNYFDVPITNAYTEGLNSLIRQANRAGRGYSFEVLRAKLLLTGGLNKVTRPKLQRYQPVSFIDINKVLSGLLKATEELKPTSIKITFSTPKGKLKFNGKKRFSTRYSE